MHLDPVFISRLQFAWVVGWHILLPAFTVGLASFIAGMAMSKAISSKPTIRKPQLQTGRKSDRAARSG